MAKLIATFYDTGICETEPKGAYLIGSILPEKAKTDSVKYLEQFYNKELQQGLADHLSNLEHGDKLEVTVSVVADSQWDEMCRLGEELA